MALEKAPVFVQNPDKELAASLKETAEAEGEVILC